VCGRRARHNYRGERKFPLIFQNIHRYFLYLALLFIVILGYDAVMATQFSDGFGIGVGTIVLSLKRDPAWELHARVSLASSSCRRRLRHAV
jgi:hypothetical protein